MAALVTVDQNVRFPVSCHDWRHQLVDRLENKIDLNGLAQNIGKRSLVYAFFYNRTDSRNPSGKERT